MLSVCIFGSQARQSADSMSDRDVLIVGSPSPALECEQAKWEANDWNVSVFERAALTRLAEVKALFIHYLKQEGQIVTDEDNFLQSVLSNFGPKNDYTAERNDALAQICGLPSTKGSYWHDLCLADITYALFRNASILHLACKGEYKFQYNSLIEQMAVRFSLGSRERNNLLYLRSLKHGYRRRVEDLAVLDPLQEALQVIRNISAKIPDQNESSICTGLTTDDYINLRLNELTIVSQACPKSLDALGPDSSIFSLWSRIRFGGGYPKPRVSLH